MLAHWGPAILFNVVLPFITYGMLTDRGVGQVPALLLIAIWPVVEIGVVFAIRRHVDEFGVLVLVMLVLGVLSALAYNSTELVFVKDSALTGLLGLAFLVSIALPRPLTFYMGRKFATDGSADGVAYWNGLWRYAGFRRTQRKLAVIWGVGFIVESGVRIALTYLLSTSAMVLVTNLLPIVVTAGLVSYTIFEGKRAWARSQANAAQPVTA